MKKPIRIQLSRKKGWRMPPNTVKVTRPSKWGNCHVVGIDYGAGPIDRDVAVTLHRSDVMNWSDAQVAECRAELGGKNLACWCGLEDACHAATLLEIANQ